jgi:hypothetical protein
VEQDLGLWKGVTWTRSMTCWMSGSGERGQVKVTAIIVFFEKMIKAHMNIDVKNKSKPLL